MSVTVFTWIIKVKVVIDPDDKIFIFIELFNTGSIKSETFRLS